MHPGLLAAVTGVPHGGGSVTQADFSARLPSSQIRRLKELTDLPRLSWGLSL